MIERKTVSQCISSDYCKGWNDAVDKMPKWISVEDDIPTDDRDVLAWVYNEGITIAWFDGYTGEWQVYGSYYGDVTHWMPLPEPPKEVNA